jgi:hypothetical protein
MNEMTGKEKESQVQTWAESVDAELYEELMNRYERILVFAGGLQEKLSQQKLLAAKNEDLEAKVDHFRRRVALDSSYIHLLEKSLQALDVMKSEPTFEAELTEEIP